MTELKTCILCIAVFDIGNFIWGMTQFFSRPTKIPLKAKLFAILNGIFCVLHLACIARVQTISVLTGVSSIIIYLVAGSLFWWSIWATHKKPPAVMYMNNVPQTIFTGGPYSLIRHPFYTAYILYWLGGVIATQYLWLITTVACITSIYYWAAKGEEQMILSGQNSSAYREYLQSTGMFFPRLNIFAKTTHHLT